jgi:hypothetical protein
MSFLNAATQKPGQHHRDRVPHLPMRGLDCSGPGFTIAWPFLLARRSIKMPPPQAFPGSAMLNIMLILTWIVAFGLAMYLATRAIKFRLRGRQQKKLERRKLRDFKRHHRFDERQHRWVRKDDGVVLVDEVIEDRRLNLVVLGWLAFVLWEGYWFWEIAQRYFETNRLELPYMFLFFILVVIPLAVYLFIRRRIRRSARRAVGSLPHSHAKTANPKTVASRSVPTR